MTETLKPFKSVACTEISAQNVFDPDSDKNTPDSIVQIQEYKGKETFNMSPLLSRSSHPFVQGAIAVQPVH